MIQKMISLIVVLSTLTIVIAQDKITDKYGRTTTGEIIGLVGQQIRFQQVGQSVASTFIISSISTVALADGRRYELPSDLENLYRDFQVDFPFEPVTKPQEEQERNSDYYNDGKSQAEKDYDGNHALGSGLLLGLTAGPIGWGIGYLIVSGRTVDVPTGYTHNLEYSNSRDFMDGYREYVKKRRKSRFNIGAGSATAIIILLLTTSD